MSSATFGTTHKDKIMKQFLLNEVALRYDSKLQRHAKAQLLGYSLRDVDERDVVQDAIEIFLQQDATRYNNVVHAVKSLYQIVKYQCKPYIKRRHFNGEVADATIEDVANNDALQLQVIKDVALRCSIKEQFALERKLMGDKLNSTQRTQYASAKKKIASYLETPQIHCIKSDAWEQLKWAR